MREDTRSSAGILLPVPWAVVLVPAPATLDAGAASA